VDPVVVIVAPTSEEPPVSPPPYSVRDTLVPDDSNRESVNEGSYNVRDAQENRPVPVLEYDTNNIPPSITGTGVHVIHLHRTTNFEGFGFHLQYNKTYFLVHKIEENSPAKLSGLQVNDVILAINQNLTDKMPHNEFVGIVGANSTIDFVVQPIEEYLRSNFRPPQNKLLAPTTSTKDNSDTGSQKLSLSKAINKLTSR
jgi:membrane-associated protease RseP (regulator of RpoE activity)